MAANKFATMLRRNTNKITLVLVYAFLEWILISLLLLNSLFSYFIIKFADYFGLKRPCIWCTRIDHLLEGSGGNNNKNSFCKDLVCEAHASEISRLSFCTNHHKLAESEDMCEDCSSSSKPDCVKLSQGFGFFPWMKHIGMIQGAADDREIEKKVEEDALRCSCCGVKLDTRFYPPPRILINSKPSMNVLDYDRKRNLIIDEIEEGDQSDHGGSDFVLDHIVDEQRTEENRGNLMVFEVDQGSEDEVGESFACSVCHHDDGKVETVVDEIYQLDLGLEKGKEKTIQEETINVPNPKEEEDQPCEQTTSLVDVTREEETREIPPKHLEFLIYGDDCSLIPVELVDSGDKEHGNQIRYKVGAEEFTGSEDFILDFDMSGTDAEAAPVVENWHISGDNVTEFSCQENAKVIEVHRVESVQLRTDGWSSGFQAEEEEEEEEEENLERNCQDVNFSQTAERSPEEDNNVEEETMERRDGELCSDVSLASEDAAPMQGEEFEADVSIGTEIPDHEQVEEYQSQEDNRMDSNQRIQEDSSSRFHVHQNDNGHDKEEEFVEFKTVSFEVRMPTANNHHLSSSLELNENEEEKVPDTSTSVESLHHIHKKLLLLERKESGTEESLDGGSVTGDSESGELTIEKLKSALKSERKALSTLYAELEEERSASAIAANQTMAMINRLQEEKAAMQMEALQYQRMMEEQSEYDQEALQLLNELMVKREKEKQEVEKELEICRKKLHEYEVREKVMLSRREGSMRSRTTSPSCSNAEDSDGLSIDLHHEASELENGFNSHQECSNQNTPVDAVLYLEESLANFEQERLSIIEQLKVLEEKLIILNYEEQHMDDTKLVVHLCEENGNGYHDQDDDHYSGQVNGFTNGHAKELNGKHHQKGMKIMGTKAKRLLPLFDAAAEDVVELSGDENELDLSSFENGSSEKVHLDKKRLVLEEEVDHVYERLQVLEADREFLKHCISSLRKGDKGLDLLQEILQHLRDLRNVELRVKNMGDLPVL